MFKFPKETEINNKISMHSLKNILFKDGEELNDSAIIKEINIKNILNKETLQIESKGMFEEIYIIELDLNTHLVPSDFFAKLDGFIEIPALYVLKYKKTYNYILSVKTKKENLTEFNRLFISGWGEQILFDFPKVKYIEEIFYKIIEKYTTVKFGDEDDYYSYVDKLIKMYKSKKSIYKGQGNYNFKYSVILTVKLWENKLGKKLLDLIDKLYFCTEEIDEEYEEKITRQINNAVKNIAMDKSVTELPIYKYSYKKELFKYLKVFKATKKELFEIVKKSLNFKYGLMNRINSITLDVEEFIEELAKYYKKNNFIVNDEISNEIIEKQYNNYKRRQKNQEKKLEKPIRTKLSPEELKKYFNK